MSFSCLTSSTKLSQACLSPTRQPEPLHNSISTASTTTSISNTSNHSHIGSMDASFDATPKAYKWRQPSDEGDENSISSYSQHSASPTDVRLLFPLGSSRPRPHPHTDGSVASASNSASASASAHSSSTTRSTANNNYNNNGAAASTTASSLSISSSFATAPQTEDDLSSIDSRSPLPLQQYLLPQQPLTHRTALPPLDSDENNSDQELFGSNDDPDDGNDSHCFNILTRSPHKFGKKKKRLEQRTSSTATTRCQATQTSPQDKAATKAADASNTNGETRQPPPPTPQHEEQHPSKKLEAEIDEHPSKKLEPRPQQPPSSILKQWASSSQPADDVVVALDDSEAVVTQELRDTIEQVASAFETGTASHGVVPRDDTTTSAAAAANHHHQPHSLQGLQRHPSSSTMAMSREVSVTSLQLELATAEESFVTAPLLLGDVTGIEDDDDEDDDTDTKMLYPEITPVKQPQVSGRVLSGNWKEGGSLPCSPDLIFLDENKDEYLNLSLETNHTLLELESESPSSARLNTSHESSATQEIVVEPRDVSFESATITGDWKRDLKATRLDFDDNANDNVDEINGPHSREKTKDIQRLHPFLPRRHEDTTEQPKLTLQTSGGLTKARSADSDEDHEILVEPRRSRPLVLKGALRENMNRTELAFESQNDLSNSMPREMANGSEEIKVEPRKSKPVVLQGNLKEYMGSANLLFRSKDDLAILPQQRQLSKMEIMVEPRSESESQVWSGDLKEIMPITDTDNEIEVHARHSKPVVLRGSLKDCMKNTDLIFQSKDDLNVLPRFQQKKFPSSMDITVEPLDLEVRRVLSDEVTGIMPLDEESNEIQLRPRRSKPFILHGDMKDHMGSAGLLFRSNDNLTFLEQGKDLAADFDSVVAGHEITFEPRETERVAVSGDLQDYVQNAAVAFHKSVLESTLVYHDTIEATKSQMDDLDEEADDAYNMDTSSIVSLQEELAFADRSFDMDKSGVSVMSDEVTVTTKNLRAYPASPEEAVIKRRAKVVRLPFPWCTPELLFVPHNELKPPPEAIIYKLPPPPINEEEELSEPGDPETESIDLETNSHPKPPTAISHNNGEPSAQVEDQEKPATVSPDDVAMLYRGKEPPKFSKRSPSLLATLARSFMSRDSFSCDSFCVDCGGPMAKCGCDDAPEDDLHRSTRMESVYSIDVGKIVSDSSAKFIMIKAPSTTKKKRKRRGKKQVRKIGSPTAKDMDKAVARTKVAEGTVSLEVSELRHAPEPEPPDSPTSLASNKIAEKNAIVPHPPADPSVDGALEMIPVSVDGSAKTPSTTNNNKTVPDPSESYADFSTSSVCSDLGSTRIVKIGKKTEATACCIEDRKYCWSWWWR